ncbi:sialate O-acetylesterase-like isoform X1 [Mytilus edulis]|uniref:sialate O-acetylesterase-like isoform X1 n=1 Tax=Mytilus edulis TaxID=6550 RepID=UPI0039F12BAE
MFLIGMKGILILVFLSLNNLVSCKTVRANSFSFSPYYANHMVLQRGAKGASIWGHSTVHGDKVQLYANNIFSGSTTVDSNGIWQSKVVDPGSNKATVITASSSVGNITLNDVLFGDVWLCSGQSNMEFNVNGLANSSEEISDASNYQNIRLFHVGHHTTLTADGDLNSIAKPWAKPNLASLPSFSAVCWLYGKYLSSHINRPIGLVESNWGGTRIEAWSSPDALKACASTGRKRRAVNPNAESVLWNGMINPLLRNTIYGAIWYQGESNAGNSDGYKCMFPAMIDDWRSKFYANSLHTTDPKFPFGFVQLAAWRPSAANSGFPDLRWSQTANNGQVPNARLQNVFMAVSMDLPDFTSPFGSIHPRLKHDIAARLVLSALAVAYKETHVSFQGPYPTKFTPHHNTNTIIIEYDHGASPLDIRSSDNFEICCTTINHVCVKHDKGWISAPMKSHDTSSVTINTSGCQLGQHSIGGVRYAWKESPCPFKQCAVYGAGNGLPGPPFTYSAHL